MADKHRCDKFEQLRHLAEQLLQERADTTENADSFNDFKDLIHELDVQQIELEMQYAQLEQAYAALEQSQKQFNDLFDFAPVGYMVTDHDGVIQQANLKLASMLGVDRRQLIGEKFSTFLFDDDKKTYDLHRRTLFRPEDQQSCEVQIQGADGSRLFAHLTSELIPEDPDTCRTSVTDITERTQTEDALRESEARLQRAQQISRLGSYSWDVRTNKVTWSQTLKEIFGAEEEEASYDLFLSLIHPDDYQRVIMEEGRQSLEDGLPLTIEFRVVRPDGSVRHVQDSSEFEFDADGNVIRVFGVSLDITERKHAEQAKLNSERLFRFTLENLSLVAVFLDRDGNIIYCNDALLKLTGWQRQEVINQNWFEQFITPEIREQIFPLFDKTIMSGEFPVQYENPIMTRTGVRIDIQWSNTTLHDANGAIIGTASVGENITERKQMEDALRESEKRLKRAEGVAHIGHYEIDITTGHTIWSEETFKIFGLSPHHEQPDVQTYSQYVHEADREMLMAKYESCIRNKEDFELVYRIVRSDSSVRHVHSIGQFQQMPGGYDKIFGIFQDITERKRAQEREIELKLERERRKVLTSFIRGATHEFRTPLATISSGIYLMSRYEDAARRTQKAAQIEKQIHRITMLVDTLLLMTRLESHDTASYRPVDIDEILQLVYAKAEEAYANTHDLLVKIQPDLPPVMGDENHLRDALWQLVDNACRFTQKGDQIIVITRDDHDRILIEIHDRGAGISQSHLPHIFKTFWRQDTMHNTPGLGLGLPIAQKIIEQHGGEVIVESELGQGTTVQVSLPTTPQN